MDYTLLGSNYDTYINLTIGNRIQLEWEHVHCNLDRGMKTM